MTSRTRSLILALAALGLFFAGWAAWVHYRLLTDPTYVSPCDINATFNCSQVYLSSYGAVGGVPVALGGMIWFTLVLLIAGFAPVSRDGARSAAAGYLFALSIVGLASILYLGYASFFVIKTACLLCIGTYVSVIGIFILSGLAGGVSIGGLLGRLPSDLREVTANPVWFLAALLFVAASASVVAFFPKEGGRPSAAAAAAPGQSETDAFRQAWNAQPRVDMGIPADGAKVIIVKFVDWQCPSCKAAYFAYKPVLEKFAASHPGAVKQVSKDYPLHPKCNYLVSTAVHQAPCEEAVAVRLAEARGKAEEMITWLLTAPGQMEIQPDTVKAQTAKILGEPSLNFDKEYAALLPAIQRDVADGGALKVNQTPTYFINGVRAQTAQGWLPPEYFELAIRIELEKAGVQ